MEPGKFILKLIWDKKKCTKAFKKIMSKENNETKEKWLVNVVLGPIMYKNIL